MTNDDTLKVLQQRTMIIWNELKKLQANGGGGGGGDCDHVIEVLQGSNTNVNLTVLEDDLGDVAAALDYIEQGGMPVIDDIAKQGSNSAANISTIQSNIGTPASGQPSTLFAAIAASGGGGSSTPQITVDDSVASIELQPNTLYIFTNRTSNLTITLAAGQQDVVNEYHMFIEIGATVPTITWPNNLNWVMSWDPIINSSAEISILNNSVIWV